MKKILLIIPSLFVINVMSAQGIDQYGKIVTDGTLNTLKVGSVTYPATNGTSNQVLTTDGMGNATWVSPAIFSTVANGAGISLTDSDSGKIIYGSSSQSITVPNNLTNGFTCTIINTHGTGLLLVTGNFFSKINPTGVADLSIEPGCTVRLNVIFIDGVLRYYVSGDVPSPI